MCGNFPNIKVVEGNAFSVLIPLKMRTFESCKPIDEDIDPLRLTNVVFMFGGVEYTPVVDERGVSAVLPADLARGSYDIVVTANYGNNPIRAAYESAVTIVAWNSQSNAQQYLPGSPIVLDAAYIIGVLSDAELESLKAELREDIAEAEQAKADAEAAKEHYDELAEQLSGVAQQGENPNATNTAILEAVQQGGGTDIAKESTSQEILELLAAKTIPFTLGECEFVNTANVQDCAGAMLNVANCTKLVSDKLDIAPQVRSGWNNIKEVICRGATKIEPSDPNNVSRISSCEIYEAENATEGVGTYAFFANYTSLKRLNILNFYYIQNIYYPNFFSGCINLIDLVIGKKFHFPSSNIFSGNNSIFANFNPSNAMRNDSQSLLSQEDIAAGFTSNLQKFLYNLREHFAANLADLTGQASKSIRMSAEVKSAILADQPTADAFTNKGWTIA